MALGVVIEIGGIAVRVTSADAAYSRMLERRYGGFLAGTERSDLDFHVDLTDASIGEANDDLCVSRQGTTWTIRRSDFCAEWDASSKSGRIRQSINPYSIDTALRILHTLLLAREGGFLLHAASAVRDGRALLFSGRSGAGKTTIASFAPSDATLLSDEISLVRPAAGTFAAFGTPFAGELARSGENVSAPVTACYLLIQGDENRIDPMGHAEAVRALLGNILFFSHDPEMVRSVFQSACRFVDAVSVRRLTFQPNPRVWEMIQ
jgi:hypothetical protein